jgi:hypothetical protein
MHHPIQRALSGIAVSAKANGSTSMTPQPGTLTLDWTELWARVSRRRLPAHRGELPPRSAGALPLDAPRGIAVCALFGQRHRFATEQEAETWRWVGSRALDVYGLWLALRHDREDVRISVNAVRHWQQLGDVRQADLSRAELRRRWRGYRTGMHAMATRLDWVRQALARRAAAGNAAMPPRQAAEQLSRRGR